MSNFDIDMLYKNETGQVAVYTEIQLLRMKSDYYMVEGEYEKFLRHTLANDGA